MTPPAFRLIAHRGAPMRAPENTLASFRIAKQLGATEIETDVQLTTDNVLVLCHDDTLTRYQLGEHRVEDLPYAANTAGQPALSQMDFGSWFSPAFKDERIATLAALLDAHASDFLFHIELKGAHPRLASETLALLKTHRLLERCVLTSFSIEQLRHARAASDAIRLGWLVRALDDTILNTSADLALFQLCPRASVVTPESVTRALGVVSEVRAWGCPRESTAARQTVHAVQAAGCIGITTDELGWFQNSKIN